MKPRSPFDDTINRLNDQDWGWWPFLRLRPAKSERITVSRLVVISLLYGVTYGAATAAILKVIPVGQNPHVWGLVPFLPVFFFFGWGAIFRPPWNRRADRLAARREAA